MKRKKIIQPYNIPPSILSIISEHTAAGFALFTFDSDLNSRVYFSCDDALAMKALKSDIVNWANAMQHIETQSTLHGILGHNGDGDEDMDGE